MKCAKVGQRKIYNKTTEERVGQVEEEEEEEKIT